MMKTIRSYRYSIILIVLLSALFIKADLVFSADEENCILCHKHKNLAITKDDGSLLSFNVDNEHYKDSIHRKIICRGCHTNITEIPHKASSKKVNCGITCHLQRGLSRGSFSHSKTYDAFMTSSHGSRGEDTPDCFYCHPSNRKKTKEKKSRIQMIAACAKCHIKDDTMKKYGIAPNIVKNYINSTHGKIFFLEAKTGPICTDCHSTHNIASNEVETSPMHKNRLFKTCAGQEASIDSKGCHGVSSPDFVASFSHQKDKDSGAETGIWLSGMINYLTLGIFYFFCFINIIRILRD